MRVRALDGNGDWMFGKGQEDYLVSVAAVAQCIRTRLKSFLGNCFFDTTNGLDWFNYLSSKNQLALNIAVSACIVNTPNVTGINQLLINLNTVTRFITISYQAQTAFSVTGIYGVFTFDVGT